MFKSFLRRKIILLVCREILTVPMTESFILFDNEYYRQHDGVAMGSPLGPLSLISFYMYTKFFGLKKARLNLDQ